LTGSLSSVKASLGTSNGFPVDRDSQPTRTKNDHQAIQTHTTCPFPVKAGVPPMGGPVPELAVLGQAAEQVAGESNDRIVIDR